MPPDSFVFDMVCVPPARRFGSPFNTLHDRIDDFRDQFPGFYIDEIKLCDNVMKVLSPSVPCFSNANDSSDIVCSGPM